MLKTGNKAQQIMEYVLVFSAIVVVFLYFIGPSGPFHDAVAQVLDIAIEQIH